MLQTYLFAGFPSALVSLKIFHKAVSKQKSYIGFDLKKYLNRGQNNCKLIYADKYENLLKNIRSFSPEMAEWLIIEGYGKVLGRKGLSLKEREVCIISILSAMKFEEQLYSHIIGAVNIEVEKSNTKVNQKFIFDKCKVSLQSLVNQFLIFITQDKIKIIVLIIIPYLIQTF